MTTTRVAHGWPAPAPVGPTRPEPRRSRVVRATLAVIAAGVLAAAVGADRPVTSLGVWIVAVGTLVAVERAAILPRASRRVLLAAAVCFLPWMVVRVPQALVRECNHAHAHVHVHVHVTY